MAKKNAYYFSHDCNARLDEKMLAVRMKHGVEGYGVYFMLVERLAEAADHTSTKEYDAIAFDFRCKAELVQSVVEDFDLFRFTEDGEKFYSESLIKRMETIEDLRNKRRAAANKRWAKDVQNNANASESGCKSNAKAPVFDAKERKEKDTTIVVSKEETIVSSSFSSNEENVSDGKPPDVANSSEEKIDYGKLIEYWNEKTGGKWGRLVSIDNNRRKMVRARITEHGKATFVQAIDKATESSFLAAAPWFSFDWMIKPNNFDKIITGNYDNHEKKQQNGTRTDNDRRGVTKPTGDYQADF